MRSLKEKYINPFTDFGFKKLFGTEFNKPLLIDFLNELLSAEAGVITQLHYLSTEQLGTHVEERRAIYDIYCENESGEKLIYIYLEMPKFDKTEDELESHFDKWLFILKNLHTLTSRPKKLQEKVFAQLFEQAEIAHFDEDEYQQYEESLKQYRDLKNSLDMAFDEGKSEGKIEGKMEGKIEAATKMKMKGYSNVDISEITGLDIEQIAKL